MVDFKLYKLLSYLSENEFITISTLSIKTRRSEKTIRKLISELGEIIEKNGAVIEKKYGKGIRISIKDRLTYNKFLMENEKNFFYDSSEDRIKYMLFILLFKNQYIKIEDLCEKLFASRKTISTDLKQVDEFLKEYHLILERKPYHGILVNGQELRYRQCLMDYIKNLGRCGNQIRQKFFEDESVIKYHIVKKLDNYGYRIYESELKDVVLQIQIALYRISNGYEMTEFDNNLLLNEIDIDTAKACAESLKTINSKYEFSITEVKYIAILISGKKREYSSEYDNIVIDIEINKLVNDMLASVFKVFNVDFYQDFELQTLLRKHMFALRVRLQCHMQFKNPMLKEIKEIYSFPYAMAAQACTVLAEYFNTIVSEDEIGYIAMCMALSTERRKKILNKRNIILVCESGAGSAKLFQYRFEEAFGDYLDKVEVCDVHSLLKKNLNEIDYIFSTVPIEFNVPVPIYQVQYFFDNHSVGRVKKLLKDFPSESILKYFRKELFFTDIKGNTKDEVLHNLCLSISKKVNVPKEFEDFVMKRELIMQTDFGNYVAIPHPYSPITEETFVSVAILEKPIDWFLHKVQVIFLLSISVNKENLENFYNISPMFMLDEKFINTLIREKSYEILISTIRKIESDYEWRS